VLLGLRLDPRRHAPRLITLSGRRHFRPRNRYCRRGMPRRLTLRGRGDVTGGGEETLACLRGVRGRRPGPRRMMGVTRRVRRGKAEMTSDEKMRASDGDREHAAEMLRNAYAAGRIDLAELHDRADAAYSATTWGELRALTADLPAGQVRSRAASGAASPTGAARPGHGPRRPRAAIWVTAVIWLAIAAAAHTAAAIPLVLLSLFLLRAASARWADPSLIAVGQAGHPVLRARRCAADGVHRPAGGASCRCLLRARRCPARGHRVSGGRAGRAPGRTLPARRGHDLAGARPWGR
jgi:Domain of unknown function (DUF1707)